jgi:hypothetical protein
MVISSRNRRLRHPSHWLILLLLFATACGGEVRSDNACGKLVYTDAGVARADYLPCAGEMIAALDTLAPQATAALGGDARARSDGQSTLRRVHALMRAAGGRKLLDRWSDRPLTDLNLHISNAVTKYDAFYMVRILDATSPYAAQSRQAAESELTSASEDARRLYRRLQ